MEMMGRPVKYTKVAKECGESGGLSPCFGNRASILGIQKLRNEHVHAVVIGDINRDQSDEVHTIETRNPGYLYLLHLRRRVSLTQTQDYILSRNSRLFGS